MIRKRRSVLSIFMVLIMTFGILGTNFVCAEETEPKQETEHSVTIDGGKAADDYSSNAEWKQKIMVEKGKRVYISASPAPKGMMFDRWDVISGNIKLFMRTDFWSSNNASYFFDMPNEDVHLKALYKPIDRSKSKDVVLNLNDPKEMIDGNDVKTLNIPEKDLRNAVLDILSRAGKIETSGIGAGAGWFGTGIGYKTKSGIGVSSQIYVKDNLCVYYQYGNTKATTDDDIRYTLTEEDYARFEEYGWYDLLKIKSVTLIFEKENSKDYAIKKGADSTWSKDSNDSMLISSEAPFNEFVEVRVNGDVLDPENYQVREGSTEVILKEKYLESLNAGTYEFEIISQNGKAHTSFTIEESNPNGFKPEDMYKLIDRINELAKAPLPEKKDEVAKAVKEYNEILEKATGEFKEKLNAVGYIVAALNGKLELLDVVSNFDYKKNTEKANKILKEGIERLNTLIDKKSSVEEINKATSNFKLQLEKLKTQGDDITKKTERLAGADRYETSIKVAQELKKTMNVDKFDAAVVAYGDNYADALSGAYLAKINNAPLLLINENNMQGAIDFIRNNVKAGKSSKIYILGGKTVMPESMRTKLEDSYTVKRLAGDDRFATNLAILEEAKVS
ncbi:hypothetical protein HMPREF0380_00675, partial [Eubacterium infirmum F0142]